MFLFFIGFSLELLFIILLGFVMDILQLYSGITKHGFRIARVVVTALAHHPLYTAVNDEHGADSAGCHAAVQGSAFYGNAPLCRLADGILFGVNGSDAMGGNGAVLVHHLFELMAGIVAVGKAGGRSNVTCYKELVIPGDDAARTATVAGGPLGNGVADLHKILIPAWAFIKSLLHI